MNSEKEIKLVGFKLWQVSVIILITCFLCVTTTYIFLIKDNKEDKQLVNYLLNNNNQDISTVYNSLVESFYGEIDEKELLNKAIDAMIEYVEDEHAGYYPPIEKEEFDAAIEGKLTGIGVSITSNLKKEVIIVNVFEKSPAENALLKIGDIIVKVNDVSVVGKTTAEVSTLVTGKEGTMVDITVLRNGEKITTAVVRKEITAPSVTSKVYTEQDKKIGYIDIDRFSSDSGKLFYEHLTLLEKEGIKGLIIDVRSNTGGYLTSVTEIASNFIKANDVIYQLKQKDSIEKIVSKNEKEKDYKVVILQNELSASASEILSVALKENLSSQVIGKTSYGKGTAQKTMGLSNGGMVKFTIQEWLSPNGNVINKKGIEPTIEVDLSQDYLNMPILENDNQFKKALEVLTK